MKRQNAQSLPTFRHLLHFFTAAFVTHTTPKRVANFLQQKMDSEKDSNMEKYLILAIPHRGILFEEQSHFHQGAINLVIRLGTGNCFNLCKQLST